MNSEFLKNLKSKIINLDIFSLGNSFAFYYLLMYGAMPLATFLHLPSNYIKWFLSKNITLVNSRILFYLFIGLLSFILGYRYFYLKKLNKKTGKIFDKQWNPKRVFLVFSALFLSGLIIKIVRILGGGYFHLNKNPLFVNNPFYSLIGYLDWLGPFALAIAFIYYFYLSKMNNPHCRIWREIAWSVFIVEFTYGFFSGSRFVAIIPIIIYLIAKHYLDKSSWRRLIVAFILIFFVLMPLQNFYKNPKAFSPSYVALVNNQAQFKPEDVLRDVVDNSVGRVSQSWILMKVFKENDNFLYGKSLLTFFTTLGSPRFIWKDKPLSINSLGNEFGRRFGILSSDNFKTSVAPTMVGDWYMNFGILGVIFGMFLIGGIFRFIYESLIKESNYSLSGIMTYSVVWIQVIKGMEDFIAPVYAGLVKFVVILLIIHFFLTKITKKDKKPI